MYRILTKTIYKYSNEIDDKLAFSDVEKKATNTKSAMNKIQLLEALVNTTSSLATTTTMAKRYTQPETVLKRNKIPASGMLTGNHVPTSLKWKMQPLDLV